MVLVGFTQTSRPTGPCLGFQAVSHARRKAYGRQVLIDRRICGFQPELVPRDSDSFLRGPLLISGL